MYTRTFSRTYIVSDSKGWPQYFFVHDEISPERDGQNILREYIDHSRILFEHEFDDAMDMKKKFTTQDEERLLTMFKLLIDARKTWQEEDKAMRDRIRRDILNGQ